MSLSFPDTPKKITPAKQVTITIAQTQAAGFVTRARGARSMSGVRSSFVIAETFGVSTSIVKSRNAPQGAFRCGRREPQKPCTHATWHKMFYGTG